MAGPGGKRKSSAASPPQEALSAPRPSLQSLGVRNLSLYQPETICYPRPSAMPRTSGGPRTVSLRLPQGPHPAAPGPAGQVAFQGWGQRPLSPSRVSQAFSKERGRGEGGGAQSGQSCLSGKLPQRMGEAARMATLRAHAFATSHTQGSTVGKVSRPSSPARISCAPAISPPSGLRGPFYSHDLSNLARPLKSRDPLSPSRPLGLASYPVARDPPAPLVSRAPQISLLPLIHVPHAMPAGVRATEAARPLSPAPVSHSPGPPTHFSRAWLSEGTAEPLPPLAYILLRAAAAAAGAPHLSGGAAGRAPGRHSYPAPRASPPRAPRGHRGHRPRGGAPDGRDGGGGSSSFGSGRGFYFLPLFPQRGLFREARAPSSRRARPRPPPPRRPRAPLLKGRWRERGWVPPPGPWAGRARAVPAAGGGGAGIHILGASGDSRPGAHS